MSSCGERDGAHWAVPLGGPAAGAPAAVWHPCCCCCPHAPPTLRAAGLNPSSSIASERPVTLYRAAAAAEVDRCAAAAAAAGRAWRSSAVAAIALAAWRSMAGAMGRGGEQGSGGAVTGRLAGRAVGWLLVLRTSGDLWCVGKGSECGDSSEFEPPSEKESWPHSRSEHPGSLRPNSRLICCRHLPLHSLSQLERRNEPVPDGGRPPAGAERRWGRCRCGAAPWGRSPAQAQCPLTAWRTCGPLPPPPPAACPPPEARPPTAAAPCAAALPPQTRTSRTPSASRTPPARLCRSR